MTAGMKAIETSGTIDQQRRLVLDEPLPVAGPTRVRVIILLSEEAEIDEKEWLQAAAANPAFHFLKETEEDIYVMPRAHAAAVCLTDERGSMAKSEILQQLENLTTTERLSIVEAALRLIRKDIQQTEPPARAERKRQLAAAARTLLPDYSAGGELTAFTALDGEEFHAQE